MYQDFLCVEILWSAILHNFNLVWSRLSAHSNSKAAQDNPELSLATKIPTRGSYPPVILFPIDM